MAKQFFNVIPGSDACCILLYGEIGEYHDCVRSADIARELLEAAAAYKKVDVRINSKGGDVYAGIAIFNALRNSSAEITIYIDGIAASIASAIAQCGKRVEMSRYARLMIHGVSGGMYGSKAELQNLISEIESLEATLCSIYAEKTGKTPEEIREAYFDGKDHWLTAQEALDLGFVDGIYDADPVPEDSTPEQIYVAIQNRLQVEQNDNNMIEKLKQRASFANCATDDDVLRRVDELETAAAKTPALEVENTALKAENEAFKAEKEAAEEAVIDNTLEEAFKDGRITDPEKAEFKAMFKAAPDVARAQLERRKPSQRIVNQLDGGQGGTGKSAWDARMEEIRKNANQ